MWNSKKKSLLKHRGEEKGEQILLKVIQKSDAEEETADDELKTSKTYRRSWIELKGHLTRKFNHSCRVTGFLILPASDHDRFRKITDFLGRGIPFPASDPDQIQNVTDFSGLSQLVTHLVSCD